MKTKQIKPKEIKLLQLNTNYFIQCLGMVLVFIFVEAAAQAQPPQPPIPKGLLTRLLEIKYTTELYLSSALKRDTNKKGRNINEGENEELKDSSIANDSKLAIYNTLRWKVDGLVYQLSGDMVAANSPRKMRLLNEWCLKQAADLNKAIETKSNKSIRIYIPALKEIDNIYQTHILKPIYFQNKTLNLTTNVFYLLKDSYTIVKGLSDMKTQKTMALLELLDHVYHNI